MKLDLLKIAKEVGFNTEHEATNKWLVQYAERVVSDCIKHLESMSDDVCMAEQLSRFYFGDSK